MTDDIDHIIELLRAELNSCIASEERREIGEELVMALAEREVLLAEQEGRIDAEPPF